MATNTEAPPDLRILTADELDAILARDDLGSEVVPMPEWGKGVAVKIRGLSMDDIYGARRAIAEANASGLEAGRVRDREWLLMAIVEPKITEKQAERLMGKSADAVLRLINRINALNGSTAEVAERLTGEFPAEPES